MNRKLSNVADINISKYKRTVLACDLDLDLDLDPQGHGTPLGAMTHLSHQSQGTPTQQFYRSHLVAPNASPSPAPLPSGLDTPSHLKGTSTTSKYTSATYTGVKFLQKYNFIYQNRANILMSKHTPPAYSNERCIVQSTQ